MPGPRQVVIDKNVLIGVGLDSLRDFAEDHCLLVSDTLLYECATATKHRPEQMLDRCEKLVRAGAHYCGSHIDFVRYEGEHSEPYPPLLLDLDVTQKIRTQVRCLTSTKDSPQISHIEDARHQVAKREFLDVSEELHKELASKHPEVVEVIKKWSADPSTRLRMLFEFIDAKNLHDMAIAILSPEWIKDKSRFCMSDGWISWHYARLLLAVGDAYLHRRLIGGPRGQKSAEHDFQDLEYALLLSRADGLLSGDKDLRALACAAFPEKDVFSSLEEVPASYRCEWAGR
jgi:hypothetical protein